AQASQLVAQPTDLLGIGSGPESATRLVQELRRQGGKARPVAGSTIADPELPRLMGPAGNGTIIPTTFYANANERARKFEQEFLKRTKAAGIERSASSQFDASTSATVLFSHPAMHPTHVTPAP